MQLLRYLLFLTFLGLSSSTSTSKPRGNVVIVTDPESISPITKSTHFHDDQHHPFQCSLPLKAADFDPSRFHSGLVDFLQRHVNFRWFLRRHSSGEPPVLRVRTQNFCEPSSFGFCSDLATTILTTFPRAVEDINNWLYTSPYNGSELLFCPRYPPIGAIHIMLGVGDFGPGDGHSLAYVPHGILPDSTMYIYVNTKMFQKLAQKNAKWKINKIMRTTLIHELVHTLQHGPNGLPIGGRVGAFERTFLGCEGRPPHGLLEGIADFVALKAGEPSLWWPARPHRSDERPKHWDEGYSKTAYFLEWLEDVRIGPGAVGNLNNRIGRVGYFSKEESWFDPCLHQADTWKVLFNSSVTELWDEYGQYLDSNGSYDYVVAFFAHRFTLAVFMTVAFGVVYLPYVYEVVQDIEPFRMALFGTQYKSVYVVGVIWFFKDLIRDLSVPRIMGLVRQITPHGVTVVSMIAIYFMLLFWICFNWGMTPLDAAAFGCCYDWFMWFIRKLTVVGEERGRATQGLVGRFTLSSRYDRVFAVTYGVYLAIILWILRGMGMSVAATAIVTVICILPVYCMHLIVLTVRILSLKARQLGPRQRQQRRRTRGQ